ncbi:hypothetical protein J5N97_013643 [Dioscorea zingiberensis]|uniref:Uncharacterized protein n=1 Tax=Dioscorea zingiberensis TaxID=325984 RepID=A0A9D5HJ09_9LILI|nr:hypothetical protein J5N97_013643 [Dioscorea zingiberensis]
MSAISTSMVLIKQEEEKKGLDDIVTNNISPDVIKQLRRNFELKYSSKERIDWLQSHVIGNQIEFETPFGKRTLTYSDHTAFGRCLQFIEDYILKKVVPSYGNTHNNDNFVGKRMTNLAHKSSEFIKKCMGGGQNGSIIFCGSGTTVAIKRLQEVMGIAVTLIRLAEVVEICLSYNGLNDIEALERQLKSSQCAHRLMLRSFSACSNVTGVATDTLARSPLSPSRGLCLLRLRRRVMARSSLVAGSRRADIQLLLPYLKKLRLLRLTALCLQVNLPMRLVNLSLGSGVDLGDSLIPMAQVSSITVGDGKKRMLVGESSDLNKKSDVDWLDSLSDWEEVPVLEPVDHPSSGTVIEVGEEVDVVGKLLGHTAKRLQSEAEEEEAIKDLLNSLRSDVMDLKKLVMGLEEALARTKNYRDHWTENCDASRRLYTELETRTKLFSNGNVAIAKSYL